MTAVTEVLRLLDELRGSEGLLDRAGLAARGASALRRLSPAQRRELAVEVARRAAPQLVPRIEAESGRDLTPAQIEAVMDLALRLDRNDIDDLITTLADADTRSALGREVTGAAVRELDDELGLDILPPPPLSARSEGEAAPPAVADAGGEDEDGRGGGQDVASPAADPELAQLEAELAEQRREIAALEERAAAGIEDSTELLEAVAGELGAHAGAPGHEAEGATPGPPTGAGESHQEPAGPQEPDEADEPTEPEGTPDDASVQAGTELDAPSAGPHVAPPPPPSQPPHDVEDLVAPIRAAASRAGAGAALRRAKAVVDELWEAGPAARRAAVGAVPDGWARRRTLERLVEAAVIAPDEAPGLLRLLDRPSDRTWVAGTMLADDLVSIDELAGIVDERALARLGRRGERP